MEGVGESSFGGNLIERHAAAKQHSLGGLNAYLP